MELEAVMSTGVIISRVTIPAKLGAGLGALLPVGLTYIEALTVQTTPLTLIDVAGMEDIGQLT